MIFNLILFILMCFGISQLIVDADIFDKIRPNFKLFKCYLCVGFHSGWIIFLLFWFSNIKLFSNIYIGCFLFGCLSSGTSNFLCSIYNDGGIKIIKTFE